MDRIDIVLITCNRLNFLKKVIFSYEERLKTPYRLIVVDNVSTDNETEEYLKELKEKATYPIELILNKVSVNLSGTFTQGFKLVESDLFITSLNDIVIPDLEPDIIMRLSDILNRNKDVGAICLRTVQMNRKFPEDNDLLTNIRACPSYFRIQRKSDIMKLGGFRYGRWEDSVLTKLMADIGKKTAITTDLWAKDLGIAPDRGYTLEYRKQARDLKNYQWVENDRPQYVETDINLDPKTNKPL